MIESIGRAALAAALAILVSGPPLPGTAPRVGKPKGGQSAGRQRKVTAPRVPS